MNVWEEIEFGRAGVEGSKEAHCPFVSVCLLPQARMRSRRLRYHVDVCQSLCPSVNKNNENTKYQLKYAVIRSEKGHYSNV